MNRENIIRMAREAGFEELGPGIEDWVCFTDEIERFAALVRAAEREACAQVCIETGATKGRSDDGLDMADYCAAAIRARMQA